MTTLSIPLLATSSQTVNVTLAGQPCRINVYQKSTGLFLDLYVNDTLIIGGVLCLNLVRIVRDTYLGFVGDLMFYDALGTSDPDAADIGSRYLLVYLSAS